MNYLLDKKIKRQRYLKVVIVVVILMALIYFVPSIFRGFSFVAHTVFRPVITAGGVLRDDFLSTGAYFRSKKSLEAENDGLKKELEAEKARVSNYNSVLDENIKLKEIFARRGEKADIVLAAILAKPSQSLYDSLIIDVGSNNNIKVDSLVFAEGNVPIGRVKEVYANTSKVNLFSNPGDKTGVIISGKDIFTQITGRGGGNFEMNIVKGLSIEVGNEVVLPGISTHTVATVKSVLSDPRDAFQKALLVSPINLFALKFVEVEK